MTRNYDDARERLSTGRDAHCFCNYSVVQQDAKGKTMIKNDNVNDSVVNSSRKDK